MLSDLVIRSRLTNKRYVITARWNTEARRWDASFRRRRFSGRTREELLGDLMELPFVQDLYERRLGVIVLDAAPVDVALEERTRQRTKPN